MMHREKLLAQSKQFTIREYNILYISVVQRLYVDYKCVALLGYLRFLSV